MGGVIATRRGARLRRPLALALAAWLLALAGATAPHLAHHAFDDHGRPTCEYLAAVQDAPGITTGHVSLWVALAPGLGSPTRPAPPAAAAAVEPPASRAPPPAPLARS